MNDELPLGRSVAYPRQYSPELLFAVPRAEHRAALDLGAELPFHGTDVWNAWELTWLDAAGLPICATAEILVPAGSTNIIESKSLKLYLNSLAMTHYSSAADVAETITQDLSDCAGADVVVKLCRLASTDELQVGQLPGDSLDELRVGCDSQAVDKDLLRADPAKIVSEELHSHLLRSLCPVTSQPDIGSVCIAYKGPKISREGLLRYIVSYRQHEDFHESCVERMFIDIMDQCTPENLTVYARYQRRGGIDINPFRSNFQEEVPNTRLWRQ